jgi:O-antigen ligase
VIVASFYILWILLLAFLSGFSLSALDQLRYYVIWPFIIYISYYLIDTAEKRMSFLRFIRYIVGMLSLIGLIFLYINNQDFLVPRFQMWAPKSLTPTNVDLGVTIALVSINEIYRIIIVREKKWLNYAFVVIMLICLILTFSRTAYLGFIVGIVLIETTKFKGYIKILFTNLIGIILLVVVSLNVLYDNVLFNIKYFSFESLYDRVTNTWEKAFKYISIFGYGLGKIGRDQNIYVIDNMYLRAVLDLGVIGFFLIVILASYFFALKYSKRELHLYNSTKICFISFIIMSFFTDTFTLIPATPILYSLIGISVRSLQEKERKQFG